MLALMMVCPRSGIVYVTLGNSKVDLEIVNGEVCVSYYSVGEKIHVGL